MSSRDEFPWYIKEKFDAEITGKALVTTRSGQMPGRWHMDENKAAHLSSSDQPVDEQKTDTNTRAATSSGFEPLDTAEPEKAKTRRGYGFPFGMTAREYETARLAAEGLYNQESAERLNCSVNTIKTHLKKVYRKLGVSSRSGLRKIMKEIENKGQF